MSDNKTLDDWEGWTHRGIVGKQKFYIMTTENEDGSLKGIDIVLDKQGGELRIYSEFTRAISRCISRGDNLRELCEMFMHVRLKPDGFTQHPIIHRADSILDYVFKWLWLRYIDDRPAWSGME